MKDVIKKLQDKINSHIGTSEKNYFTVENFTIVDGGLVAKGKYSSRVNWDAEFLLEIEESSSIEDILKADWDGCEWVINYGTTDAKQLEKLLDEGKKKKDLEQYEGKVIEGFTLRYNKKSVTVKGKKYEKMTWQAHKGMDGKSCCVYIGSDPSKAETKIKNYLAKKSSL